MITFVKNYSIKGMDNSWVYALVVWSLKEAYQSFIGSRAKTIDEITKAKKEIVILQCELKNAVLKIDDLQHGIDFLKNVKRQYRD